MVLLHGYFIATKMRFRTQLFIKLRIGKFTAFFIDLEALHEKNLFINCNVEIEVSSLIAALDYQTFVQKMQACPTQASIVEINCHHSAYSLLLISMDGSACRRA